MCPVQLRPLKALTRIGKRSESGLELPQNGHPGISSSIRKQMPLLYVSSFTTS
jgi:hypothetical protein